MEYIGDTVETSFDLLALLSVCHDSVPVVGPICIMCSLVLLRGSLTSFSGITRKSFTVVQNLGAANIHDVLATPNHMRSSIVSVSLFGEADVGLCTTVASMWTLWSAVDVMVSESVGAHESDLITYCVFAI
ncbi:hypothetical protein Syun_030292 [Stephania yunnanensis]|uniref:Uncharacterized protein n=1 Tax=Stephania yunnanensis TaxID=152371 RepID=A0AAP0HGV4_9MAGN